MADAIIIGAVGAPFGLQGWVHMKSFTEPPGNLLRYRPWLHRQDDSWVPVEAEARAHRGGFVACFAGCADRDQAMLLRGREVAVPADALPPTQPDEYYWRDLIGCQVVSASGDECRGGDACWGRVERIFDTPAHDVLVVDHPQNGSQMIPFVRAVVLDVDLDARRIRVDWQGGAQ